MNTDYNDFHIIVDEEIKKNRTKFILGISIGFVSATMIKFFIKKKFKKARKGD